MGVCNGLTRGGRLPPQGGGKGMSGHTCFLAIYIDIHHIYKYICTHIYIYIYNIVVYYNILYYTTLYCITLYYIIQIFIYSLIAFYITYTFLYRFYNFFYILYFSIIFFFWGGASGPQKSRSRGENLSGDKFSFYILTRIPLPLGPSMHKWIQSVAA